MDISDQQESPALPLAEKLRTLGADLAFHDPCVPTWTVAGEELKRVEDLGEALSAADAVVLPQAHSADELEAVARTARLVLDTRGRVPISPAVERL